MRKKNWKRVIAAAILSSCVSHSALAQTSGSSGREPGGNDMALVVPSGLRSIDARDLQDSQFLSYAHFTIPFDVDRGGNVPREIRLWVSPDLGSSWMMYGKANASERMFEFHAAREGEYLFAVQAVDARGSESLGGAPPMRIVIDTTKPMLQLQSDINAAGRLVVDFEASDRYLDTNSLKLSYSIDGASRWPTVELGELERTSSGYRGRSEIAIPHCREVDIKLIASDAAQNVAEATTRYAVPRTASAGQGLQLAGHRGEQAPIDTRNGQQPSIVFGGARPASGAPKNAMASANGTAASGSQAGAKYGTAPIGAASLQSIPGSTQWNAAPSSVAQGAGGSSKATLAPRDTSAPQPGASIDSLSGSGQLTGSRQLSGPGQSSGSGQLSGGTGQADSRLTNWNSAAPDVARFEDKARGSSQFEELPTPVAIEERDEPLGSSGLTMEESLELSRPLPDLRDAAVQPAPENTQSQAFHSRSRSFSLDYSVESLNGAALASIELWGTEDNGRTWLQWGSDPDRESPFDVQVGNDGMFGFRMVVIGTNGLVGNRPSDGDTADMWINVDTSKPAVKISRALYGEGADAGTLVIDYVCKDDNLHERPIKLSYSERATGPWITIASGLANNGLYLWKADPSLPNLVYLRIEAVDRAGNTSEHRLELPIDLRGLAPRGRIQGFRPIESKP